jgi:hypothetical protein
VTLPDAVATISDGIRAGRPELRMRSSSFFAKARRRATDIAREEATLRADAAWRLTYSETFARVFDETLAELLAEQRASEAA